MSFINTEKRDRTKFIGGSDIAVIMGLSPYKTAYQLWLEKTGQVEAEDISLLPHVQRGILNEPIALEKLQAEVGMSFEANKQFNIYNSDFPELGNYMACEVDGYNDSGVIVEIKCMGKEAHENVSRETIPEHYKLQCEWNMMVTGAKKCIFASYRPEDGTLHTIELTPADKKPMIKAALEFWKKNILGMVAPEYSDKDFVSMESDQQFKQLEALYLEALEIKKTTEENLKDIKANLDELMGSHKRVKGSSLKLTKYERKGNVNYKKVPELKGVDLEPYRGKSIEVFDVRAVGNSK